MRRRKFMTATLGALALAAGWTIAARPAAPGAIERSDPLPTGQRLYRGADLAFGTTVSIQLLHTDEKLATRAIADAFSAAKAIDLLMSIYSAPSQVHTLNRDGILQRPSPHLQTVLNTAQQLSERSAGAFDITVQPLWLAAEANTDPRTRRKLVNWRHVRHDSEQVSLQQPGMAITLNGIAQGYATDLALAALRAHGIAHALVDIGEFRATGRRSPARPWALGIRHPRQPDQQIGALQMDGRGVATSGDYETTFSADFSRNHIFDPHTCLSPTELASATVIAPSAVLADGLSTAMMVMGAERSLALAREMPELEVVLVGKDGRRWETAGFPWVRV